MIKFLYQILKKSKLLYYCSEYLQNIKQFFSKCLIQNFSLSGSLQFILDPACQEINTTLNCYVADPACTLKGRSEEQIDVGKIIGFLIAALVLVLICVAIGCFQKYRRETCRKGMYN